MKVVTQGKNVLRLEHKSWRLSLTASGLYLFFASGVSTADDLMLHQSVFGVLFCAVLALVALMVTETSRVTFDRESGSVLVFRKTAFRTARLTLPLADLNGAYLQRSHYHRGWHKRPALVFDNGDTVLVIPACRNGAQPGPCSVVDMVNEWLGTDAGQAKRRATRVWTEPKTELEFLARFLKRRFRG